LIRAGGKRNRNACSFIGCVTASFMGMFMAVLQNRRER
jgi:hypothetical protein